MAQDDIPAVMGAPGGPGGRQGAPLMESRCSKVTEKEMFSPVQTGAMF